MRGDEEAEALGFVGSPTYLAAGRDLFPAEEGPGHAPRADACRVYSRSGGRVGPLPGARGPRPGAGGGGRIGAGVSPRIGERAPGFRLPDHRRRRGVAGGAGRRAGGRGLLVQPLPVRARLGGPLQRRRPPVLRPGRRDRGDLRERRHGLPGRLVRRDGRARQREGLRLRVRPRRQPAGAARLRRRAHSRGLRARRPGPRGVPRRDRRRQPSPARVSTTYLTDALDAVLAGGIPQPSETRPVGCTIKWTR